MEMTTESNVSSTVAFWIGQIDTYEQKFQPWEKRSKEIIDRYRDERKNTKGRAKFNILWSNVQTLSPALYARPPKVNIDRRFQDNDDLGRYSALVLERASSYFVGQDMFDDVMKQSVLDRLLSGRGTTWIRYVPTFKAVEQVTDDMSEDQELMYEDVVPDYVHWCDFGHTWARTWQEVRGVWRRVFLSRAELVKRFGEEIGNKIPLDARVKTEDGKETDIGNKAVVYEIWDRVKKKALWVHRDMPEVLDEKDDPLKLKDFFPCPKPLYSTLTNDSLVPVPDYILYQDQARELDTLTGRIESITKALKVAGVYAADAQGLDRLLSEGTENKLIPVDQWAAFAEKGGLAGVFSLMPMNEIVQTLVALYEARDKVKQDLYEITGISDVIRGATKANETATAQQLKGQYASLRLDNMQKDVSRFSRDMVRIITEIIAEHFSIETIKQISGIKLLTEAEKQQLQIAAQSGQPLPEELTELLDLPTWEQIEQIIRDDAARCFRIDIETDSTIKTDQEAEKAARTEFLNAAGTFIQQMVQVPNPELQPLLMEMLMFGVRGFKVSRELETTFDSVIDKMKKAAENPAPPQPDPAIEAEARKAEMEGSKIKNDSQIKMLDIQSNVQIEQQKNELEKMKLQLQERESVSENQIKQAELQIKQKELEIKEAELQLRAQEVAINAHIAQNPPSLPEQPKQPEPQKQEQGSEMMAAALAGIAQAMNNTSAPKKIIRNKQGLIDQII